MRAKDSTPLSCTVVIVATLMGYAAHTSRAGDAGERQPEHVDRLLEAADRSKNEVTAYWNSWLAIQLIRAEEQDRWPRALPLFERCSAALDDDLASLYGMRPDGGAPDSKLLARHCVDAANDVSGGWSGRAWNSVRRSAAEFTWPVEIAEGAPEIGTLSDAHRIDLAITLGERRQFDQAREALASVKSQPTTKYIAALAWSGDYEGAFAALRTLLLQGRGRAVPALARIVEAQSVHGCREAAYLNTHSLDTSIDSLSPHVLERLVQSLCLRQDLTAARDLLELREPRVLTDSTRVWAAYATADVHTLREMAQQNTPPPGSLDALVLGLVAQGERELAMKVLDRASPSVENLVAIIYGVHVLADDDLPTAKEVLRIADRLTAEMIVNSAPGDAQIKQVFARLPAAHAAVGDFDGALRLAQVRLHHGSPSPLDDYLRLLTVLRVTEETLSVRSLNTAPAPDCTYVAPEAEAFLASLPRPACTFLYATADCICWPEGGTTVRIQWMDEPRCWAKAQRATNPTIVATLRPHAIDPAFPSGCCAAAHKMVRRVKARVVTRIRRNPESIDRYELVAEIIDDEIDLVEISTAESDSSIKGTLEEIFDPK